MRISCSKGSRMRCSVLSATAVALLALGASGALANGISQSGEQKDMRRVGHANLQGRAAYHPYFINYPDGRVIAFVGTHSSTNPPTPPTSIDSNLPKPNPLKPGSPVEANGTMIVDVTNPSRPVEKFHIPGPRPQGGAQTQSNRMCLGSDLPHGIPGKVYMMRNVQVGDLMLSGYEVWDVTDVRNPTLVSEIRNIRNTHKHWWECKTGIAYLPGSKGPPAPQWRRGQSMVIVDWSNPLSAPTYLRTHGLPGGQPGGTGPVPPSLHGPISTHEHPNAAVKLVRGATADDVIGNRLYLAWGVGDDGVLQILDRKKLLPFPHGTWSGDPDTPTNEQLESAQTSILYMSPDQGGHTSFPMFGLVPKSYQDFTEFRARDIVLLASESTADRCEEAPHWSFVVDVTVENSKSEPPGTRVQQNVWQGPMVISSLYLDPRRGEKYKRGNYCKRGARFGVHSSEENFYNPYYGRLTFLAYFTGGVRAYDIREPQSPVEVAFYVPESNRFTEPAGYMTNNLEVDDRGYILAVDRNGAGLDILELRGKAKRIGLGTDKDRPDHHDKDD
jgi:LVIVD repeat